MFSPFFLTGKNNILIPGLEEHSVCQEHGGLSTAENNTLKCIFWKYVSNGAGELLYVGPTHSDRLSGVKGKTIDG